jgi:hypothetical protein
MQRLGEPRQAREGLGRLAHPGLQVVLREDEEHRADDRPVHASHAADHDDEEDVGHHLEGEHRLGPHVAQPQRHEGARERGGQGRDHVGERAVHDGAVAQGLGAEVVLADRLQHAAEVRVHDPQQHEEDRHRGDEHQVVGGEAPVHGAAEELALHEAGAGPQELRHGEAAPVLAAGEVRELRGEHAEHRRDRERDHREEERAHAQREQSDGERQHQGHGERRGEPREEGPPRGSHAAEGEAHAVRADAVEHGVRERHDARVAQQQVVGGHQHDEDADRGRGVEGARAAGGERRDGEAHEDGHEECGQDAAARQVVGKERAHQRRPTG